LAVTEAYLGLGTNLGAREDNLYQTLAELVKIGPLQRSSWYRSEPVDMPGAPWFLNGTIRLWTTLSAAELLTRVQHIEEKIGRQHWRERAAGKKMPRIIDIDIIFYGAEVIGWRDGHPDFNSHLIVPHPRLHERAFVLLPLAELAPDIRHPVFNLTAAELLLRADQRGVKRWKEI